MVLNAIPDWHQCVRLIDFALHGDAVARHQLVIAASTNARKSCFREALNNRAMGIIGEGTNPSKRECFSAALKKAAGRSISCDGRSRLAAYGVPANCAD